MQERIVYLMKKMDLGTSALAELTGIKPSSISHVVSGRNKPGFEFIQKVLQAIPELNARWFLTGEGEMYTSISQSTNTKDVRQSNAVDLFSSVNTEKTPPSSPRESNISNSYSSGHEKLQSESEKKNSDNSVLSENTNKIERIVFFYTNGSFKEYQPDE